MQLRRGEDDPTARMECYRAVPAAYKILHTTEKIIERVEAVAHITFIHAMEHAYQTTLSVEQEFVGKIHQKMLRTIEVAETAASTSLKLAMELVQKAHFYAEKNNVFKTQPILVNTIEFAGRAAFIRTIHAMEHALIISSSVVKMDVEKRLKIIF